MSGIYIHPIVDASKTIILNINENANDNICQGKVGHCKKKILVQPYSKSNNHKINRNLIDVRTFTFLVCVVVDVENFCFRSKC